MPYLSRSQQKKFHVLLSQGKISKKTVDEWDKASKGKKLPEHVKKASCVSFLMLSGLQKLAKFIK